MGLMPVLIYVRLHGNIQESLYVQWRLLRLFRKAISSEQKENNSLEYAKLGLGGQAYLSHRFLKLFHRLRKDKTECYTSEGIHLALRQVLW